VTPFHNKTMNSVERGTSGDDRWHRIASRCRLLIGEGCSPPWEQPHPRGATRGRHKMDLTGLLVQVISGAIGGSAAGAAAKTIFGRRTGQRDRGRGRWRHRRPAHRDGRGTSDGGVGWEHRRRRDRRRDPHAPGRPHQKLHAESVAAHPVGRRLVR